MKLDYRSDIDGLRAVAVVLVILFHTFPVTVPGGYVGVDVFFVISGYVITLKYYPQMLQNTFTFRAFYAARARRLLPALSAVILLTLLFGYFVLLPFNYESLGLQATAGSLFFPNILAWSQAGYFDPAAETKPLLHLWSLGVEEQFYLIWPLLLIALARYPRWAKLALFALATFSFIYCLLLTQTSPVAGYYNPLSRLWELGAGGLIAVINRPRNGERAFSIVGMFLILAAAMTFDKATEFPGWRAAIPVAGACLVIAFGLKALSHKMLVAIGQISYPAYLWHWPLISFVTLTGNRSVIVLAIIVFASFVLAWLTAEMFERQIRFRMQSARATTAAAAAALLICLFSFSVWISAGIPQRFPEAIRPTLANMHFAPGANARVGKCWLDSGAVTDFSAECSTGRTLVWGDSHAARLYAGLSALPNSTIAQFTRDGCIPSVDLQNTVCDQSNTKIVRRIAELKPDRVIIFAFWMSPHFNDSSKQRRIESLKQAIVQIKKSVPDVILVGPAPVWSPDLVSQMYAQWRSTGTITNRLPPMDRNYDDIEHDLSAIAASGGAGFKSILRALCNEVGCLTQTDEDDKDLLSFDYGHFTTSGARFVVRLLGL